MPGPSSFDKKVYKAMERPEYLPDEYKSWLPKYLRYLSSLQVTKTQIPGIMGELWHNVGAPGEPAFAGTWTNYGAPWAPARFYKDYSGIVRVRGLVKAASATSPSLIFTLPAGYRPDASLIFAGDRDTNAHVRIDVGANGDLFAWVSGAITYLSLSNIDFRAV